MEKRCSDRLPISRNFVSSFLSRFISFIYLFIIYFFSFQIIVSFLGQEIAGERYKDCNDATIYIYIYVYVSCFLRSEIVLNRQSRSKKFEVMFIRGYERQGRGIHVIPRIGKWCLIFQMCGLFDVVRFSIAKLLY